MTAQPHKISARPVSRDRSAPGQPRSQRAPGRRADGGNSSRRQTHAAARPSPFCSPGSCELSAAVLAQTHKIWAGTRTRLPPLPKVVSLRLWCRQNLTRSPRALERQAAIHRGQPGGRNGDQLVRPSPVRRGEVTSAPARPDAPLPARRRSARHDSARHGGYGTARPGRCGPARCGTARSVRPGPVRHGPVGAARPGRCGTARSVRHGGWSKERWVEHGPDRRVEHGTVGGAWGGGVGYGWVVEVGRVRRVSWACLWPMLISGPRVKPWRWRRAIILVLRMSGSAMIRWWDGVVKR
ncbi:hypothetical protein B0I29_112281 [Actinoplanes lutulentus]|uniref:Uncharacterized protein n=1 Tax=Actinoplanes lutulentus TaxID=1287878 RepID=A0A327ZDD4_9ACTN|nr:hypothetical protein B0I29_112281 [Actinoplanes lutulentus]